MKLIKLLLQKGKSYFHCGPEQTEDLLTNSVHYSYNHVMLLLSMLLIVFRENFLAQNKLCVKDLQSP